MARSSAIRMFICVPLLIAGLIVLAWPEENNLMMVQFSKAHGPSGLDLIGIAIILAGYFPLIFPVFTRFHLIQQSLGRRAAGYLVILVIIFSILIATGLALESELLLWTSVAISAGAQTVLVYKAISITSTSSVSPSDS